MHKMLELIKKDTWVFPYLKSYKKLLVLIIFLGFMTTFSGAALMFTSGFLISRSAQIPENILMVYVPIVLTRAFGIGRPTFRYAERLVSHNWVLKIVSVFRRRLYELVEVGTKSVYAKSQTGEVLNVLDNDLFKIENFYLRTLFPTVIGLVIYVLIAIGVGIFNWGFALAILLILGMTVIVAPMVTLAVNGARDFKQQQLEGQLYTDLTDSVMGLQDWILAGRTQELFDRQQNDFDAINKIKSKQSHFNWWRDMFGALVIGAAAVILMIFATRQFGNDSFGVNWIAAFVLAIFPAEDALTTISTGVGEWPRYQDSIQRLNKMDAESKQEWQKSDEQSIGLITEPEIKFNQVNFGYNDSKLVLENLNLTIKNGQKLAILGQSGAGKTTLLKLLLGDEHPDSGAITINDHNISALQQQRSDIISVLDQQPHIFASSVANNLRLGNLKATDEQLWDVLKQVSLIDLVRSLPEGLDTPMTEMGSRFSGGEQQRFALARVLLQDTPIVVLDEPTVALDPITELTVLKTIFEALSDRTIIWVTHHLTGIEFVDDVIFIENKKISMQGTPEQLMTTEPRFKRLLQMDHGNLIDI
ncbi:thiol reductant ABC exporter subunit CydC [Weissella paramesenteroides]|uniref:thiol reductant ABC exporter subunit CydC n=1 Tax=Weissella paramesenteroides TaxID=1249 RepID=UPI001040C44A|nr:thiol reductant ABC exporter subunit CydC [Weissella paramesenteroides]RZQ57803.1 thiol reductant ABC exporter subunit CydC [Weissella paramesenteroides]